VIVESIWNQMDVTGKRDQTCTVSVPNVSTIEEAAIRINDLENELRCMTGVMRVMREDLQVCYMDLLTVLLI
jgi:hypothetical protein